MIKNLCDTCSKTIADCDNERVVFAGDIYALPEIRVEQLDAVIACDAYKE